MHDNQTTHMSKREKHLWCKVRWLIPLLSFALALLIALLATR
ncbi:MAG: hypothetical protein R8K46_10915 [Mariprofundaceae bacterium]